MFGVVLFLVLGMCLFYGFYSTSNYPSLAGWTWAACNSANGYLHGRLVPFVFIWMVWWAWKCKREEVVRPSYWGMIWLLFGMILFWASVRSVQPRFALLGAPFVVVGLGQYLFGWKVAKTVVFPAFFLWFMIPVPGLEGMVMGNWQGAVTWVTLEVGDLLGMDLVLEGGLIEMGEWNVQISRG